LSDYTKTTDFAIKDGLATGNPSKVIKGTEHDAEYNNIATAVASKADSASPTFTGVPVAPTPATGTRSTQLATMQKFADEFSSSFGGSFSAGYQKFPSGLILQWGTTSSTATTASNAVATFPIAFPTACNMVYAVIGGSAPGDYTVQTTSASTTTATFTINANGAYATGIGFYYLALGN
jgi:hypothetical protein